MTPFFTVSDAEDQPILKLSESGETTLFMFHAEEGRHGVLLNATQAIDLYRALGHRLEQLTIAQDINHGT